MKAFYICLGFLAACFSTAAQTGTIKGTVRDAATKEHIISATVTLLRADSSVAAGAYTGPGGAFSLNAPFGKYRLRVTYISYLPLFRQIDLNEGMTEIDLGMLEMKPSAIDAEEVLVEAERSQIEFNAEKRIYNVGKDLTVRGGTAEDVLQNVPSVTLDQDGNVSLRGGEGVRILINGRQSGLTGISTGNLLKQLPADAIESVEIISNPSAKYDAEGSVGIINIVLKRNQERVTNGIVSGSAGWLHDHNLNATLAVPFGDFLLETGIGGRYSNATGMGRNDRTTFYPGDSLSHLNQRSERSNVRRSLNGSLGLEFRPDESNIFNLRGSYSASPQNEWETNRYEVLNDAPLLADSFGRRVYENEKDANLDLSFGFQHAFPIKEQKLTFDVSYFSNTEGKSQNSSQYYEILNSLPALIPDSLNRQSADESQENLIMQADYSHPFEFGKIETGFKSQKRLVLSDVRRFAFDRTDNSYHDIPGQSNEFEYDEWINAAYLTFSTKIDELSLQAGLRAENSDISSLLHTTGERNDRKYMNFFPSSFLSYGFGPGKQLQLSVSRRINRPRMGELNPFVVISDPYNIRTGNPFLNPEFTWAYELNNILTYESTVINTGIFYRHTDDVIQRIRTIDSAGISTTRPSNFAEMKNYGAELFVSHDFSDWYKANVNITVTRGEVSAVNLDPSYKTEYTGFFGRLSNTFKLPEAIDLQANIFYRGPTNTVQGKMFGNYSVDFAISREFFEKRLSVTLRGTDIFRTGIFKIQTNGSNFFIDSEFYRLRQRVYLGFSYKFNDFKEKRRKNNGGEMNNEMEME